MSNSKAAIPIDKKKKETEYKPTKTEMFMSLADYLNGSFSDIFKGEQPKFPNKYYIDQTNDGERRLLLKLHNDTVQFSQVKRFKADVLSFTTTYCFQKDVLCNISERMADEFFNFWELYTTPIETPPAFRFKSDPGLCFSRMPFDPIQNDGTPCRKFKDICSRLVCNEQAFRAFIGSIFVPESDRQQYLWIKGEGLDGKGCTIRFLEKCLGPAYMNTEVPAQKDQFWNAILPGKRLCCFSDVADLDFPASPKFKMLSGGDAIPIREMRKLQYLSEINCKFMFASNYFPEISGQKSDQRRAIVCELDPSGAKMNATYEKEMWEEEAPYIIGWCIDEYKRLCPNDAHIPVDAEIGKALASGYEADVAAVFNRYFELIDGGFVSSMEMDRVFRQEFKSQSDAKLKKFRRWIKSYHGINPGGKLSGHRGYLGVHFRPGYGSLCDCR